MKKKYIKYIVALTIGFQLLGACTDDFVELEPKGKALEENYYKNAEQAYRGLIAAYDPLGWNNGYVVKTAALNSVSDDFYAGGGGPTDINAFQVWDNFTLDPVRGPQGVLWNKGYSGVYRCNVLISKLPDVPMDEALKARYMGEAKFLRAYYYFDLIRLFERIPLITEPLSSSEVFTVEQVDGAAVYEQIEADLMAAIPDLPATVDLATEAGRATQGAARALLGKVYLQQKEYAKAAEQLKMVNGTPGGTNQYDYELLDNFANLWKLGYEFNSESIFEISHNSTSEGQWSCLGCTEGNPIAILTAPRGYVILEEDIAPSYVSGWSFNTVTPSLVNAFVQGGVYDPRYDETIANIDSLEEIGAVTYTHAHENTGYFLAKFAGKIENKTTTGAPFEINFPTNEYQIRLAGTYLLEAEALVRGGGDMARAQALLDAVRARVGLDPVPATADNIMKERRLELAGEGHRWFDLIRTGKASSVLADRGFVEGKHDKLPIPRSELEFDNTLLVQDPAYK